MTFSKISKTQKWPPKYLNTKKSKNSKSHIRRPQIKKVQKINYSYNWKILRMTFSKISKTQKWPPKPQKTSKNDITLNGCPEHIYRAIQDFKTVLKPALSCLNKTLNIMGSIFSSWCPKQDLKSVTIHCRQKWCDFEWPSWHYTLGYPIF